jgi:hypothetical protein
VIPIAPPIVSGADVIEAPVSTMNVTGRLLIKPMIT